MRVETERLYLYPISNDEMHSLIEKEADAEMKQAYTEMLEGCLTEPDNRIWYAVWNMELKNVPGTIVGDFCFKGLGKDGVVEIGYGLREEFRHQGYMVETVKVITEWALSMEGVCAVEAETDPENVASQNVLRRAGFVKNGVIGEEGPRFVYRGKENERESGNIIEMKLPAYEEPVAYGSLTKEQFNAEIEKGMEDIIVEGRKIGINLLSYENYNVDVEG